MNLIGMESWKLPKDEYSGRYTTEDNFVLWGFYKKLFKHKKPIAMCSVLDIHNGHVSDDLRFPNVEIPFKSEMVNWRNLIFRYHYHTKKDDGTYFQNEDIVKAVLNHIKPVGFIIDDKSIIEECAEMAKQEKLPFEIMKYRFKETHRNYLELGIANTGTFGENFDIDNLILSYKLLSDNCPEKFFSKEEEMFIRNLSNKKLSDFLIGYDYANPVTKCDFILTGLMLGYPIESTVAVIRRAT